MLSTIMSYYTYPFVKFAQFVLPDGTIYFNSYAGIFLSFLPILWIARLRFFHNISNMIMTAAYQHKHEDSWDLKTVRHFSVNLFYIFALMFIGTMHAEYTHNLKMHFWLISLIAFVSVFLTSRNRYIAFAYVGIMVFVAFAT